MLNLHILLILLSFITLICCHTLFYKLYFSLWSVWLLFWFQGVVYVLWIKVTVCFVFLIKEHYLYILLLLFIVFLKVKILYQSY